MSDKPLYVPPASVPVPPKDADVLTTACDYCIVACGYKVYRWPVGKDGDLKGNNAFNATYPVPPMSGTWVSPNQHNIVTHNGREHHIAIVGDKDTTVVNVGGDHSVRGGTIAKKCYNPKTLTKDRLLYPQVRVNGKLQRISWDDAMDVMAEVSKYVIEKRGKSAWGMKMFSYQYWENTHALTKLALRGIETPAWAVHDQPTGHGPDTPGMSDAGIDNFSAAYEDWGSADVLLMVGTDPFEAKTIIFNDHILKGIHEHGMKVISVVPRKTQGVAYGEKMGGMYLEINPGTDLLLINAMARIIVENGWEDSEFVSKWIQSKAEHDKEVFQADGFDDFKEWITNYKYAELDVAVEKTGIPAEKIKLAAEMIAKPNADGTRKKASFAIEKGLYWSNNYGNTAAITALGLICGAGNRPGQVISRFGGHQRGMMPGGKYPAQEAPEKFPGWRKQGIDLDRWTEEGNLGFAWVIGTTWIQAMTASRRLEERLRLFSSSHAVQASRVDKQHLIETYKRRVDAGGLMLVHQDIYPVEPIGTEIADFVLPASTWGENDFTRANGERRIRLYSKFYDAPGETKADWEIAAMFAKRMGLSGFDWKDSNDVFEDAAFYNKSRRTSYVALVEYARKQGKRAHEVLRSYGTNGIQAPIRWENGELVGTKRLHDSTLKTGTATGLTTVDMRWLRKFNTKTGKANLLKAVWETFGDYWEFMKPDEKKGELWVTSGRINEIWQSGFDDQIRRPYLQQRWPDNWVEIHPDDAKARGIENGDMLEVSHDRVPVEVGGYSNSQADRKLQGATPFYANADIDSPDELQQMVDSDYTGSRGISARVMDNADLTEPDELLGFVSDEPQAERRREKEKRQPLEDDLDLDDPLMKSLESGIGLKWDDVKPMTFTEMMKNGQVEMDSASFKGVALVTDNVKKGVVFTYFNTTSKGRAANSLAGRVNDPISQRPRYKLARGVVKKIGESDYKHSFAQMSFKSRAIT